ncbi:MAG: endonuclease domain-containing protein [Clostridia bacterium]|nr:endonuclease domain-containing protein [Clostridia bacterium]MBQ9925390.1 endonuclease domain-containing protein [Clostridia bacterium]
MNRKLLKEYSRELRKQATPEENHLWYDFLRKHELSFNRQFVIGTYIVDFYCNKAKLAIELDGSQHFEPEAAEYDKARSVFLNEQGISVLRFTNRDLTDNFEGVCRLIDRTLKARKLVFRSIFE